MRRFRLTIAYDGTNYSGWQVQRGSPTIQAELETALEALVRHPCKVNGSGRTDRGVHAAGQVAHVDLETRMTPAALRRALNSRLPDDIRVVGGACARADFHARRDASAKEYRYFVWNEEFQPPFKRHYATHVRRPLDVALMRDAAARFVGDHDFTAFMANPNREIGSSIRSVTGFEILKRGARIEFRVRGNGFLYKQVRSMVGLLLRIGEGAESPELITRLLSEKGSRTARVPSAPPQGLFLWKVWY